MTFSGYFGGYNILMDCGYDAVNKLACCLPLVLCYFAFSSI